MNPNDSSNETPSHVTWFQTNKCLRPVHDKNGGKGFLNPDKDSEYDPYGPNFNGKKWGQRLIALQHEGDESFAPLKAGIAYSDLSVHGYGTDTDFQSTVSSLPLAGLGALRGLLSSKKQQVDIIRNFDGLIEAGEMLVVLGPPGSGCSTLLKTIAGEMGGIVLSPESKINYRGISADRMHSNYAAETLYSAEVDIHFPNMTVGQTLDFAARARSPRTPPGGLSAQDYATSLRDVVMALFGIAHTVNTKVGNDYVRGVSGGERKRVSIAEAMLSGAPLTCWDNSTRGLDSANAVEFCKTLRTGTELISTTAVVAIYQAPQAAYDLFDKVVVLYEGEQIYFGRCDEAKQFFIDMGFECPEQQTVPDFLTSLTSSLERKAQPGKEHQVPHTPQEFAAAWRASETYKNLKEDIARYDQIYPVGQQYEKEFHESRRAQQSKHLRAKSKYTLSYGGQVSLCLRRGFQRLVAEPELTLTQLFGNFVMALVIGSVFYNLAQDTASFYSRAALLFFAVLINAFASVLEILTLYAQRPIVEKQSRYGFYHPSAEAIASMLTDMPYKILNAIVFNLTLYFMANLRREPGACRDGDF